MESGAKGCEVVVSGKLRGQRAKSMKFVDGLMIHSGDPVNYYVDTAVRHVLLRQGEWDPREAYVLWKTWHHILINRLDEVQTYLKNNYCIKKVHILYSSRAFNTVWVDRAMMQ